MSKQFPPIRQIREACYISCKELCRNREGSDQTLCEADCQRECFYEELLKEDPCLAVCANSCGAVVELVFGRLAPNQIDCLAKCRDAICR